MARVKRGVVAHAETQEGAGAGQGVLGPAQEHHPGRQGRGRQGRPVRLPRPQGAQALVPGAVESQRINAAAPGSRASPTPDLFTALKRPGSRSTARCLPDIAESPIRPLSRPSPRRFAPLCWLESDRGPFPIPALRPGTVGGLFAAPRHQREPIRNDRPLRPRAASPRRPGRRRAGYLEALDLVRVAALGKAGVVSARC